MSATFNPVVTDELLLRASSNLTDEKPTLLVDWEWRTSTDPLMTWSITISFDACSPEPKSCSLTHSSNLGGDR
ncbi:MAG: hypothetical protein ACXW32_13655 [Limisphaerales bacterium]